MMLTGNSLNHLWFRKSMSIRWTSKFLHSFVATLMKFVKTFLCSEKVSVSHMPAELESSQDNGADCQIFLGRRGRHEGSFWNPLTQFGALTNQGWSFPHFPGPLPALQKEANRDDDSGYAPTSVGGPEEVVEDKPSEEAKGKDSGSAPPESKPSSDDPKDKSDSQDILHLPKDKKCAVCQEAGRVKGPPHVMTDEKPSEKFGDRIHDDHIIVAKNRWSSEKKGTVKLFALFSTMISPKLFVHTPPIPRAPKIAFMQ